MCFAHGSLADLMCGKTVTGAVAPSELGWLQQDGDPGRPCWLWALGRASGSSPLPYAAVDALRVLGTMVWHRLLTV